ncbi:MAG: DUF4157 domain-containing protein [Xanthomonadaceae bacterium]|nr:DUF4157 domain-containing protein [Xanthomonadaceae bacterium]
MQTQFTSTRGATPKATSAVPLLRRKCGCGRSTHGAPCSQCTKQQSLLQRRTGDAVDGGYAPTSVQAQLGRAGQPLDTATRAFMEPRFGFDFSAVRVHDTAPAAASAGDVGAAAYTVGRNIVFGAGRYAPSTHAGKEILAHELTHVIQQGGAAPMLQRRGHTDATDAGNAIGSVTGSFATGGVRVGAANDPQEAEADAIAADVMRRPNAQHAQVDAWSQRLRVGTTPVLRRRLVVNPGDSVPMPPGVAGPPTPLTIAVQGLMNDTCPDGQFTVNPATGAATAGAAGFCNTPPPRAPAKSPGNSSTPTGCACLCDVINNSQTTTIAFGTGGPGTSRQTDAQGREMGEGGRRMSPTVSIDPRFHGQYRINGNWVDIPFYLIFAHEVCGHALPKMQGTHAAHAPGPAGGTPPSEQHAVDVERSIAAEHKPPLPRRPDDYSGAARERP